MSVVPKIVSERLRAVDPLGNHPDADLLTAFSERMLPERERGSVLEHLAGCRDCREIVALALPVPETVDQALAPAPRSWFAWPVLRWGLVAAGIAAVGSFGLMQYRRNTQAQLMAYQARSEAMMKETDRPSGAEPASQEPGKRKAVTPAGALTASPERTSKPVPRDTNSLGQPADRGQTGGEFSSRDPVVAQTHGPKVQWQNNLAADKSRNYVVPSPGARQSPPPWASQPASAFAGAPAASEGMNQSQPAATKQTGLPGQDQEALSLPTQAMPLQPSEGGQGHTVERAKDPGTLVFGAAKVPGGSLSPPPAAGASPVAQSHASWMVTGGGLERSLDQGKTWQSVDVNNSSVPAGTEIALTAATPRPAAVTGGGLDAKKATASTSAPPTVFRAVASNGAEVWAGGSNGALYHSADAGSNWERIVPSSAGKALTGDVVSLDFPDSRHGRVSTSTGEIWLTGDAGRNWQNQ
jgi:Photosynthesis system II assembly factor YCF48